MCSEAICRCFFFLQVLLAIDIVNGNAFLAVNQGTSSDRMSEVEVQTTLLEEVEGNLGTSASSRVGELEVQLRPIFDVLPKNSHGGISNATVSYVLHRLFVLRHGWFIQGLHPAGESWNVTSPSGVLKDHVPEYLQELFEKRLHGKGFGLHELAVLGATIEHLVHSEALARLGNAFTVHNESPVSQFSKQEAIDILETYMVSYIVGKVTHNFTSREIKSLKSQMTQVYAAWPETQVFIRGIVNDVAGERAWLDFTLVARAAERLGEDFGKFQNKECVQLKDKLLEDEVRGTGRVRLAKFYKGAADGLDNGWQFQESVPYLQQLGALDESDPEDPKVIVINYLSSQANCISSSSFYSVCCMDECENLLSHIEQHINGPEATPEKLISLVTNLPSATIEAPHELSATLRRRLHGIAESNGGVVPLHGRLFAQWMHHAYPRECPYPHLAGTTKQVGAFDVGDSPVATMEDIQRIIDHSKSRTVADAMADLHGHVLPWSEEEELFVLRTSPGSYSGNPWQPYLRHVAFFAAVASMSLGLIRTAESKLKLGIGDTHKYNV